MTTEFWPHRAKKKLAGSWSSVLIPGVDPKSVLPATRKLDAPAPDMHGFWPPS